jgi:hypothetical protein
MLRSSSASNAHPVFKVDIKRCIDHRHSKPPKSQGKTLPLINFNNSIRMKPHFNPRSQSQQKLSRLPSPTLTHLKERVISILHNDPAILDSISKPCIDNLPRVDKSVGHRLKFNSDVIVAPSEQVIYPHLDLIQSLPVSNSKPLLHYTFKQFQVLKKELRDTSKISYDLFQKAQKVRREKDRFRKEEVRDMNPREIKQVIQHWRRERKRLV